MPLPSRTGTWGQSGLGVSRDLASVAEPATIGIDLGERAAKSRDLINQYRRRAVGTRPALGGDQVVGLMQIGFGYPVATEHHAGQLLAPAQADQHARWIAREPAFGVNSTLEAAERLGSRHAPIVEVESAISASDATCQTVHRDIFERMKDDERHHDDGRVRDSEGR